MVTCPAHQALSPAPSLSVLNERTNTWLAHHLMAIWNEYFPDVPCVNQVEIEFARSWRRRLGVIRLSESGRWTYIGINHLLQHQAVPETICDVTIAHELVHYAHGFGSPLPRPYRHPHHGNVVTRELVKRGLGAELQAYQYWTTHHWYPFYEEQVNARPRLAAVPLS
ncbi:MAG: hypothetical protein HY331_01790 [Chloroflexi bacterium]|nr:hypothetical protein [Chloroflexota bacterium]